MNTVSKEKILSWNPCRYKSLSEMDYLFGQVVPGKEVIDFKELLKAPVPIEELRWVVLRKELFTDVQVSLIEKWCIDNIVSKHLNSGKSNVLNRLGDFYTVDKNDLYIYNVVSIPACIVADDFFDENKDTKEWNDVYYKTIKYIFSQCLENLEDV